MRRTEGKMYLPSKKIKSQVHTLAVLIFSNLEHEVQSNIGVQIICSGHHQRDGFLHLHVSYRIAFSKPLRTEVSSRSTKSQVKEDIQNNNNNKHTTILDSRSFALRKLNKRHIVF